MRREVLALLGAGVSAAAVKPAYGRSNASVPPPFRGALHQFTELRPVENAPDAALASLDGGAVSLAHWRGEIVVLNFWATWCAPCLMELSALEALAARPTAGPAVVAVSVDRGDTIVVDRVVQARNLRGLTVLLDPEHHLGAFGGPQLSRGALPLYGLPMTYVLDRSGGVRGYMVGPADWASADAQALLNFIGGLPAR